MKTRSLPLPLLFGSLLMIGWATVLPPLAWACMGTSVPTCSRSVFLAKFVPRTVCVPDPAAKINVPIGVLPFVTWTKGKPCAQPVDATLDLTLFCEPVGGGAPIPIGPQTFPLPVPKNPGAQPVLGGVVFMIPAGTFAPGDLPQVCTVQGTYTVTFGPGTGTGPLAATGDTQVCLVEPAPGGDPTIPRLDMQYLNPDPKNTSGFQTCRRGDQAIHWFILTNNDFVESVIVDLDSVGNQVARLPDGFSPANLLAAYNARVHAISSPVAGTDTFPAAFADELAPGELIPEGDPSLVDPFQITRNNLILGPGESTFIPVATRSHGMCADGSCSERTVKAVGLFEGGDDALACASTALLVGNSAKPKSPLVEFTETIKVNAKADCQFSESTYGDAGGPFPHSTTFGAGNLPPNQPAGFQLSGKTLSKNQQPENRFPDKAGDNIRIGQETTHVLYDFQAFIPTPPGSAQNFHPVMNQVEIAGLDVLPPNKTFALPAVIPNPVPGNAVISFFDIFYDISIDQVQMTGNAGGTPVNFNGTLKNFLGGGPNFAVDKSTCRTFTRNGSVDLPVLALEPLGASQNIARSGLASLFDVFVSEGMLTRKPGTKWSAKLNPVAGAALGTGTKGLIGTPVGILHQIRGTAPAASMNISWLHVHVAGSINSPFMVPVNTRVVPDVFICDGVNDFHCNLESGDYFFFGLGGEFLSGRGKVKGKGADCTLTDKSNGRNVSAMVNVETGAGDAQIEAPGIPFTQIIDTNAFATCP